MKIIVYLNFDIVLIDVKVWQFVHVDSLIRRFRRRFESVESKSFFAIQVLLPTCDVIKWSPQKCLAHTPKTYLIYLTHTILESRI